MKGTFSVDASATAKRCEKLSMIAAWFRNRVILNCQKSSGNIGASKEHHTCWSNIEELATCMSKSAWRSEFRGR